jgi:hypothetical protein
MNKQLFNRVADIAKEQKQPYKIKLSLISNIEDELSRGFSSYNVLEDYLSDAQSLMTKARDILKFEMLDASLTAEETIEELEQELKELGVDEPAELKRFRSELSQLEKLIQKAEVAIKNIG